LEGAVTVFQAFSVFTQPVQIQLGDKTLTLQPDRRGSASAADGTFRVKNASPYGVVYGGLLEFEASLSGGGWLGELRKLDLFPGGTLAPEVPAQFILRLGKSQHTANTRIVLRQNKI
jgi:hypothetical protein